MRFFRHLRSNLTLNMICTVVFLLVIFGTLATIFGYYQFSDALTEQYNDVAYRTAETAVTLVNPDLLQFYLRTAGEDGEYQFSRSRMDNLCNTQNATFIYVIVPDTTDYRHITFIYNTVNENSGFEPFEIGYVRETTNDEYAGIYRDIYENGLQRGTVVRDQGYIESGTHITTLVPLNGKDGSVKGILCVQRPMEALTAARYNYVLMMALAAAVLAILSGTALGLYIRRELVRPIRRVTGEAKRFAKENTRADAEFTKRLSEITDISTLALSIDAMEEETLTFMQNLTAVTAEKERLGTELSVASQIQEGLLPTVFPPFPDRKEFDIYASMVTAKEVGGDFYDFFFVDQDHLALVMADVSGKGIPAALFMMASKITINEHTVLGGTPGEILTQVNQRICENNKVDMFVTVWLGILELSTGKLTFANAGHDDPAIYRKDRGFEILKTKHGFVIGGMEGMHYQDTTIQLEPGDGIYLYTDGVPEATDSENRQFGMERMIRVLNDRSRPEPQRILEDMKTAMNSFVGQAPQFDDITMLCLRYDGGAAE